MIRRILSIGIVCIIFISSMPILTIANEAERNKVNIETNILSNPKEDVYKEILFIYGFYKNLEIHEEKLNDNVTIVHLDFFAKVLHVKGGIPAHAGGWGVVPPKFYNDWIILSPVSVELIATESFKYMEKNILITEKFMFITQYYGFFPFSKIISILWMYFAPILNLIYPFVKPFLDIIEDIISPIFAFLHQVLYKLRQIIEDKNLCEIHIVT